MVGIQKTEVEKSLADIREGLEESSSPGDWPKEAGRELLVLYDIATTLKLDMGKVLGKRALDWLHIQIGELEAV